MIKLQVVLVPPSWARSNASANRQISYNGSFLPNSSHNTGSPVASSTPNNHNGSSNSIYGEDYRKLLHLARPIQTLQEVCDDIIDRFAKLYPDEE